MNILIPNSWLKNFLDTNATVDEFAKIMSLTSVSIERIEKVEDDYIFDIEVTTNRPDLMSVIGIAKEASAVLPQHGYTAKLKSANFKLYSKTVEKSDLIKIENDPSLVNRIMCAVFEIDLKDSPAFVKDRLTKTGIRSINNVVDVTNYVMREVGHPSHAFDYDRLTTHLLKIRKSKSGERVATLDDKNYLLEGGDIIADDGTNNIVDLVGVMGTSNSSVTPNTKRVLLFIDNNNPTILRKTSMRLGIRTEAVILNEKGVDPELMPEAFARAEELLTKYAKAKRITPVIDIYPNKVKTIKIKVSKTKIDNSIGVEIPQNSINQILKSLGFKVEIKNSDFIIEVPTSRINDVKIPEDIIEEIARVYGYHKIPSLLPASQHQAYYHQHEDEFYWIQKVKNAFKFWGFTETYTYSLVSEELFEGPIENAVKLKNPLTEDRAYLRTSLTPSLFEVYSQNNQKAERLFEIANVYKKTNSFPKETVNLAILINEEGKSFFFGKGIIEEVAKILGISNIEFSSREQSLIGANIIFDNKIIGYIEEDDIVTAELNLELLLKHSNSTKKYTPSPKYPPVIEDVRVEVSSHHSFDKVKSEILRVSDLITDVDLLDVYGKKKTFRVTFQSRNKNLTNDDILPIRNKLHKALVTKFKAIIG